MSDTTLDGLYRRLRARFAQAGVPTPELDARILIAGHLDIAPARIVLDGDRILTDVELEPIEAAALRRLAHEPVYRILGKRAFYGRDFRLSAATLEPRPDTEILVDSVLPILRRRLDETGRARILDLGAGTGAIVLTLLAECPAATGVAVDLSEDALAVVCDNAIALGVSDRLETIASDWFAAVTGQFDLIVSNPPYIASTVVDGLSPDVRLHDPRLALDGGADGLVAYRQIAARAGAHLENGGTLALEIGYDQRESVTALFRAEGFRLVEHRADYAGQDRVLVFDRAS